MLIPHTVRRLALPLVAAGGALLLPAAADAAVIPFGTNLDGITANSDPTTTCDSGPWWIVIEGHNPAELLGSSTRGSCQFTSGGLTGTTTSGLAAPTTGRATAARVKVGAVTGRMRINVVRSKYEKNEDGDLVWSLPYLEAFGPTFTPAANSVTTVPLDLPMRSQPLTSGKDPSIDWLALEVQSGDVPVPAVTSPDPDLEFHASYPGPSAIVPEALAAAPLPDFGMTGIAVAMNADLTTPGPASTPTPAPAAVGGSTPTPTAAPAPGDAPAVMRTASAGVSLVRTTVKRAGGRVPIELNCQGADCVGRVTLLHRTARGAGAPTESLGQADLSAKVGTAGRVRISLNARGRALLRRKRVVHVHVSVALSGGGAPTTLPFRLLR